MHSADAARDFVTCVELQSKTARGMVGSEYLRSHVCLGDAYAKNRQMDKARTAWQAGLKIFPDAKELKGPPRHQGRHATAQFVESHRSLERPIDTDLSFMDRE